MCVLDRESNHDLLSSFVTLSFSFIIMLPVIMLSLCVCPFSPSGQPDAETPRIITLKRGYFTNWSLHYYKKDQYKYILNEKVSNFHFLAFSRRISTITLRGWVRIFLCVRLRPNPYWERVFFNSGSG